MALCLKEPSWLPLSVVKPAGLIPFFRKDNREVSLVASGTVEAQFECATDGIYAIILKGRSTPAEGVYAVASVSVDGKNVDQVELKSQYARNFPAGEINLTKGEHKVTVKFTNDLFKAGEDRNLYLNGIGFLLERD